MTDRELLAAGTGHAAWGYFFLYFDFNLGIVNVLPDFVGMLLFLNAIGTLEGLRREMGLLRPLGRLMCAWQLGVWLGKFVGFDLEGKIPVLGLIVTLASLYFHFQLMTDFAALARQYLPESESDRALLRWRTVQTVLLTVSHLMMLAGGLRFEWMELLVAGMAVICLISGFLLMTTLFSLRGQFRAEQNIA